MQNNSYRLFNTNPKAKLIKDDVYDVSPFIGQILKRPFGSKATLNIKTGELKMIDTPQNIEDTIMIFETAVQ